MEMQIRKIPYEHEKGLPIFYRERAFDTSYKADFICFGSVIVGLKALNILSGTKEAKVINYLKASGLHKGLLLNFGSVRLQYKRFVLNQRESAPSADKNV